jgi:hypothetical protein
MSELLVKPPRGKALRLRLPRTSTIGEVKVAIARQQQPPPAWQQLSRNGQILSDDSATLEALSITRATLELALRPPPEARTTATSLGADLSEASEASRLREVFDRWDLDRDVRAAAMPCVCVATQGGIRVASGVGGVGVWGWVGRGAR